MRRFFYKRQVGTLVLALELRSGYASTCSLDPAGLRFACIKQMARQAAVLDGL